MSVIESSVLLARLEERILDSVYDRMADWARRQKMSGENSDDDLQDRAHARGWDAAIDEMLDHFSHVIRDESESNEIRLNYLRGGR